MNRWVLPAVLLADVAVVGGFFVWHQPVLRVLSLVGLVLIGVLLVLDTVLERRAS